MLSFATAGGTHFYADASAGWLLRLLHWCWNARVLVGRGICAHDSSQQLVSLLRTWCLPWSGSSASQGRVVVPDRCNLVLSPPLHRRGHPLCDDIHDCGREVGWPLAPSPSTLHCDRVLVHRFDSRVHVHSGGGRGTCSQVRATGHAGQWHPTAVDLDAERRCCRAARRPVDGDGRRRHWVLLHSCGHYSFSVTCC